LINYSLLKQKKYRDSENKFLIEGIHLVEECLKSKYYRDNIEKIFVLNGFSDKSFLNKIDSRADVVFLDKKKFSKLSETVTPQGVIAVVSKNSKHSLRHSSQKVTVAVDSINDPGNLGTIIRTCYWFNVDELIVSKNSADIFNSKVIRSSQGAIFNVNIKSEVDLKNDLEMKLKDSLEIILCDVNTENYLSEFTFNKNKNYVLVFGNESKGISKSILQNKDYRKIKIKNYSECESLNVAVAAGIVIGYCSMSVKKNGK